MKSETGRLVTQWHVRVMYKHKRNPRVVSGWFYPDVPFPSKQAAEEYARGLFGVEKWELKELVLTEKEAAEMETVRQIMAHWKAVYEPETPDTIQ